jgi:anti-anti-sigma factor
MSLLKTALERYGDDVPVLRLAGDLDAVTVDLAERAFERASEVGKPVILDLDEVSFIDSGGINWLFALREERRSGEVVVQLAQAAPVARVLELVGFLDATPHAADRAGALRLAATASGERCP